MVNLYYHLTLLKHRFSLPMSPPPPDDLALLSADLPSSALHPDRDRPRFFDSRHLAAQVA